MAYKVDPANQTMHAVAVLKAENRNITVRNPWGTEAPVEKTEAEFAAEFSMVDVIKR